MVRMYHSYKKKNKKHSLTEEHFGCFAFLTLINKTNMIVPV